MAGFLRKKVTSSRKKQSSFSSPPLQRLSSDAPPSLPPLILSSSLADPDPNPRAPPSLPPAASPPAPPPAQDHLALDDLWDPWKAYADAPSPPRLDSPLHPRNVTLSPLPLSQSTPLSGPFSRLHFHQVAS